MRALARWLAGLLAHPTTPPPPTRDYRGAFGLLDGSILNVEGRNYVPQKTSCRVWWHNTLLAWAERNADKYH